MIVFKKVDFQKIYLWKSNFEGKVENLPNFAQPCPTLKKSAQYPLEWFASLIWLRNASKRIFLDNSKISEISFFFTFFFIVFHSWKKIARFFFLPIEIKWRKKSILCELTRSLIARAWRVSIVWFMAVSTEILLLIKLSSLIDLWLTLCIASNLKLKRFRAFLSPFKRSWENLGARIFCVWSESPIWCRSRVARRITQVRCSLIYLWSLG